MGVMVAKLSKASVDQKKWMAEVRSKARDTAEEVVREVKKSGLSEETAEEIRKKILGIV
jgi:DNA-binding transcriptional regulator YhcF (GntR family)